MSVLKKNIILLGVVQAAQFIIPLLQLPYLSRTLGVSGFAVYVYALSLLHFVSILVDYGLGVYLPQKVALARNDRLELNRIFSVAFFVKLVMCIPAFIIYILIAKLYSGGDFGLNFFLLMSIAMVFNGFSLAWLFQGLESLRFFAGLNLAIKILGVSLVFLCIKSKDDLVLLAFINLSQFFFLYILSVIYAFVFLGLRVVLFDFSYGKTLVFSSFSFFVSRVFAAVYTTFSTVYLGVFGAAHQVALFGAAEQFYKAAQQVFYPFSQALYPYMVRTKDYSVFKRILLVCMVVAIVGACFGHFTGKYFLGLVFGSPFDEASGVLSVFMLTVVVSSLSLIMGYPALAPLGFSRNVNYSVMLGGGVQMLLLLLLAISTFEKTAVSMVVLILICEGLVLTYRCYSFYRGVNK